MKTYLYNFLPNTKIYYYQDANMFCSNTDTALLGNFMHIKKKDIVLDIGTNNGALLLYAMQHSPKKLIGVEMNREAAELAKFNLSLYNQNVEIYNADILNIKLPSVSCIVCNPPYFPITHKHKNQNFNIERARHESFLPLENLIAKVSSLLHDKGRFYMVHRASRLVEILDIMKTYNLEPKTLQFVYHDINKEAKTILIEAMKNGNVHCKILPIKLIHK